MKSVADNDRANAAVGGRLMDLRDNALFVGLSAEAKRELGHSFSPRRYAEGSRIIAADDRSTDLFLVVSGRLSVRSFADDGHEVAFVEIGPGAFFGELAAIDGGPRSADVMAAEESVLATMRAEALREAVLRHPQLGLNLAIHLAGRVRDLSGRVFEVSTLRSSQRIRRELLRLARNGYPTLNAVDIRPAPTHYEIAARTSTHREAVSRELSALATRRILRTGRKTITIIDMAALERLAES